MPYDKRTSRQALRSLEESGRGDRHRRRVLNAVRDHPGKTALELMAFTGLKEHQIRPRLTGLLYDGHVAKGPDRVCTVRGSMMATWIPHDPKQKGVEFGRQGRLW